MKINLFEQTTYNWGATSTGNGEPSGTTWEGPYATPVIVRIIGGASKKPYYHLYQNLDIPQTNPIRSYYEPLSSSPTSPTPSPPSPGGGRVISFPNPTGGPPITITLPGSYRTDWKLRKESTDPEVQDLLDRAKRDADSYTRGNLRIWLKPPNDEEVVVLAGRDSTEEPHLFVIAEDPDNSGKTGWINDEVSPPLWERFEDY